LSAHDAPLRADGQWKIVAASFNSDLPPAAPPPLAEASAKK